MNVDDLFGRRINECEVARILVLIATTPNRRERPRDTDSPGEYDFWFDGGAARVVTGSIHYFFADGIYAQLAAPIPGLSVEIQFPNGAVVRVQQGSFQLSASPSSGPSPGQTQNQERKPEHRP